MVISQNIPALNAQLNMQRASRRLAEATKRLSSGYKINSAKDDPAGLAISNKLSLQLAGIGKATDNASNGVALVQTAEGALNEVHGMLQRMRELAVQAATDTLNAQDRDNISAEIDQLMDEIQATASRTEYNGIKILNGEGSRITESKTAAGATDTSVSTVLFVSEDVPPGSLSYDITQVGLPASLTGANPAPTPTANVTTGGGISINGIDVGIVQGESYTQAMDKINEALSLAGITPMQSGGVTCLVSNIAGSNQTIDVQGDAAVLAQFGLAAGKTNGTDAVISNISLKDNSTPPREIATDDDNSLVASADGNQVSIKGTNGEVINFNIQSIITGVEAGTTGATAVNYLGTDGAGNDSYSATKSMQFDFKDYGPIKIQVGGSYNNNVSVYIPKLSAETLGLTEYKGGKEYSLVNYNTLESAQNAITQIDDAIAMVSTVRSRLGAFVNRLESTVRALDVATENTSSSRSRIQDTDIAKEMTEYAQMNVMYQAGIAILTQSNQRPTQILQLLN